MKLEEKLEIFKTKGWTADVITGEIFNTKGKISDCLESQGYVSCTTTFEGKKIKITGHQFIWYIHFNEVPKIIDHINGIKDDNRITNLREVTNQENCFNRKNAKGFTWNKKTKKFRSKICVNGKNIYLGYFTNEVEAHESYLEAKKIHHKF